MPHLISGRGIARCVTWSDYSSEVSEPPLGAWALWALIDPGQF